MTEKLENKDSFLALEKSIDFLKANLKEKQLDFELYGSVSTGLSIDVKDGVVESFRERDDAGVGLKIIKDKKPAFGFANSFDEASLKELVEDVILGIEGADVDEDLVLIEPSQTVHNTEDLKLFDDRIFSISEEEKIETAREIEKGAKESDKRISAVRNASYSEGLSYTRIVNSLGLDVNKKGTTFSGSVMAVATVGDESQTGWDLEMKRDASGFDGLKIGKEASRRALEMLGAREIETIKCPAIFENLVMIDFLSNLSTSFLGDNVFKGKSLLANKLDEKVFSDKLTIHDCGTLKGGWASSPFDAEGVGTSDKQLVKSGVVKSFLYDSYWAKRAGTKSTGNAARGGYKGTVCIGTSNFYIEEGKTSFEELLKHLGTGLYITDVMGTHTIDAITGDFSLGASGFFVENGEIKYPVRGMAIAGNILQLFNNIKEIGSDKCFIGSLGSPSILFNEISAGGK